MVLSILDFSEENILMSEDIGEVHTAVKLLKDHTDEIGEKKDKEFVILSPPPNSKKGEMTNLTRWDLDWIQIFALARSKYKDIK